MKVDNPDAFRFILQDEVYLLAGDKASLTFTPSAETEAEPEVPAVAAPVTEPGQPVVDTTQIPVIQQSEPVIETPRAGFNYLGGNNKNFTVLVNYAEAEFMPPAHLTALESILKRKELLLEDVAIFNIHPHAPVAMAKVMEVFKPVKLLILGKDALPQGIGNLPLNQPVQGKKTHVLYSFSFDEMMSSNGNKKTFWDQMKTL